jgi:hypothetical protein
MTLDLNALRARYNAETAKIKNSSTNFTATVFDFRNLKVGDSVRVRFIDDTEKNDVFWRERRTRNLKFNSVKDTSGAVLNQATYVDIPAFNKKFDEVLWSNPSEEYLYANDEDVIQKRIGNFWDGTDTGKELYNKFKRRKTYVMRGFLESDVEGYERNKVYRFIVTEDLFNLISSFMSDTEIAYAPTDKVNGLDFIINVTGKNSNINGKTQEVKDYTTSKYARKETPLSEDELNYLNNNELPALITYIYKKPNAEQEKAMVEMFEAVMNDEPYDVAKWGNFYKPNNIQFDGEGKFKLQPGKVDDIKPAYTYTSTIEEKPVEQKTVVQETVKEEVVEESPVRVNNLIEEHSQETTAVDAKSLVADIMSKYNIQK